MTDVHLIMILDDDTGISSKAYDALRNIAYLTQGASGTLHDILDVVNLIDGRFYLPVDRRERLRTLRADR